MKKNLFVILAGVLAISPVVKAETVIYDEAKEPSYSTNENFNGKWFFANGTEVEITAIDGQECAESYTAVAKYTWNGGEKKVCLTSDTNVFGGSEGKSNLLNSKITMTGGKINSILGGGYSNDKDNVSKVANVEIYVEDAILNNSTYAGGCGYVEVENASITVVDSVYSSKNWAGIHGGGVATVTHPNKTSFSVGANTYEGMKTSPNRVENVEIILNSATVTDGTKGVVYAGGQGLSYVGNSYVLIKGESNIDYLTSGGSHGYTGIAKIEVEDGTIGVLQSVNRGFVDDAYIAVTGGEITNLYIGGETEDSSVNGTVYNVDVSINGGRVINLNNGTNAGVEMTKDATNAEDYSGYVEYLTANVTNDNLSLPTSFTIYPISLTSETDKVIEQVQSDNEEVVIIIDKEDEETSIIDKTVFQALAEEEDKMLIVTEENAKYVWAFDSNNIGEFANNVNTGVTVSTEVPENLKETVKSYENIVLLDFAHSGALPEGTMFVVEVASELKNKVKLYHYNEETKEYELLETEINYTEGNSDETVFAAFTLDHCSTYMLASEVEKEEEKDDNKNDEDNKDDNNNNDDDEKLDDENKNEEQNNKDDKEEDKKEENKENVKPPQTGDNFITYILVGIISLLGLVGVSFKAKKRFN